MLRRSRCCHTQGNKRASPRPAGVIKRVVVRSSLVPCWIYLRADEDAITCEEPADVVLKRVESAEPGSFIPFEVARLSRDDGVRTGYIRAGDIVAVMPMHPRQVEAELEDPPDWLQD